MSLQAEAEPPNATQGFPALDVTAAGIFDLPWHNADDQELDFHLDQLDCTPGLEGGYQFGQGEHPHPNLMSEYHSNPTTMALQTTDGQTSSLNALAGENSIVKTDDPGIAHDMSTQDQIALDHLQYQLQSTQHGNHTGDAGHHYQSASAEPKQEASLDTGATSSDLPASPFFGGDDIYTSQIMHRHNTDPTPASIPSWLMSWPKERNQMASSVPDRMKSVSGNRHKAGANITSHPRQLHAHRSYAPTQPPNPSSYHSPVTASQANMNYLSQLSPAHGSYGTNPYTHMMANSGAGYADGFVNNSNHQHKTNRAAPGSVRSSNINHSTHDHHHMPSVPQQYVLKSHVHDPTDIEVDSYSGVSQKHTAPKKRPQQREMSEEASEEAYEDHVDELHYDTIDAAKIAERQPFRVNPKKDESIPWTDSGKRELVVRMVRCMTSVKYAQDNAGMVRQWNKLKQDEARVEQAAWRILGMVLEIHIKGIPMLPNKPSCMRYQRFMDRWDAICEGLSTQKTMCKHLLGAEFTAQLVNDPLTATQRVTNNRKVNAGKKEIYSTGRQGLRNKKQKRGRASSSSSIQVKEDEDEDGDLDGLGEEDAEGETDEEYQASPTATSVRATTAQMIPREAAGSRAPRAPKRERDADESEDEDDRPRPNKYLRMSIAKANHRPSHQGSNSLTPKRQNDSRSQFQTLLIKGKLTMCDLNDPALEDVVYNLGTPTQKAIFTKIHYPNGRPVHRMPRAAAPSNLREDHEDDLHGIEDGYSGSNPGEDE
ncbi:MAG: hypothetical protein L6R37_000827 [Teloschistes peruensis]|nr:MAG: hypothetical protein L6R37_000827 [Teloschistes peruensis]